MPRSSGETELSAQELRDIAFNRAQDEIDELLAERRAMLKRHSEELRPLESRVARLERLKSDIQLASERAR